MTGIAGAIRILLSGALAVLGMEARAGTLFVPAEYPTIQAAVDASVAGDSVLVAPGTYTDSEIRIFGSFPRLACVYLKDGVRILSEQGPDATTIDMLQVVYFQENVIFGDTLLTRQTSVEGFTITGSPTGRMAAFIPDAGGSHMMFRDCIFRDLDGGSGSASAIGAARSDLEVHGCVFTNCVGGLATVYQLEADMYVSGCLFEDCGRGIYANSNTAPYPSPFRLDILDSEFRRCQPASGAGGAILASSYNAGIQITNCWFEGNVVPLGGGAVEFSGTGTNTVSDCVFWNNHSTLPGSGGGALFVGLGGALTGNTFYGNGGSHAQVGGTVIFDTGNSQMSNNVFASTTKGTALHTVNGATITGGCNVFWDNPDGEAIGYTQAATDRIIDPQFCDPDSGDFTVTTKSPCLPADSQGCGQIGARGWGCEPISIDPKSWGEIKAGYRLEPGEGANP
ncbi:MAG: right-handed parallel beta-helix repeat-containing protein [Candidatus Eiseniibacteriota bacterium]